MPPGIASESGDSRSDSSPDCSVLGLDVSALGLQPGRRALYRIDVLELDARDDGLVAAAAMVCRELADELPRHLRKSLTTQVFDEVGGKDDSAMLIEGNDPGG